MYLALKEIDYRAPDCTNKTAQVGDPVEGFGDWSPWVQRALIDEKRIRWAPEGLTPAELQAGARRVEQRMPSSFAAIAPAPVAAPSSANQVVVDKTDGLVVEATGVSAVTAQVMPDAVATTALSCDDCGKSDFASAQGLKIHKARAHKT